MNETRPAVAELARAAGAIPLDQVATIRRGSGPNTINRENVRRRIIVQCNTAGRDLNSVVTDIQKQAGSDSSRLAADTGYFIEYGGQFESQRNATRMIGLLSLISLAACSWPSTRCFARRIWRCRCCPRLPMAAIGAVAALVITGQSLTVASMVGFISLSGIASRNGILLIAHYLHLVKHEGEQFTPEMIERAGKERLAPMLMTALTAGIALIPLVLAAGEPGKEILVSRRDGDSRRPDQFDAARLLRPSRAVLVLWPQRSRAAFARSTKMNSILMTTSYRPVLPLHLSLLAQPFTLDFQFWLPVFRRFS